MGRTQFIPTSLKIVIAVGAAFMLWGLVLASPAWAATYTVNSTADTTDSDGCTTASGGCTLREAITAANNSSGVADTIDFDAQSLSGQQTILLSSGLPTIDGAGLTIDGGNANITISGDDKVRVFQVHGAAKLALSNLTVADGNAGSSEGGGISNFGTLTVSDSTISGNSVPGVARFGGSGGGIFNAGMATVINSTISGNSASIAGGGMFNGNQATLTVINSTISGNRSGDLGGGIYNLNTLTVINSTISDNSASNSGGGIMNNAAGDGATATLKNTIVANSTSGGECAGDVQPITDGGYNLDTDGTCVDETVTTSMTTNPQLDPAGLKDNGGPTKTIALCSGVGTPAQCAGPSDAIDAIPDTNGSTTPACDTAGITTDQRGVERPQGAACDIGAFESAPPPALSINDITVTEGDGATTSNATFTVSLSEPSVQTVTVNYSTDGGTATAGTDYEAKSGTLTFAPGSTSKDVSVTVNGDNLYEDDETFFVNLSSPTNAEISDAQGKSTITNDDPPDTTAPTTTVALDPDTPDGDNGWYKSTVGLKVGATDDTGGSGVAETRCLLDPASVPDSFDELPSGECPYGDGDDVITDGEHTLYAASVDAQGNEETPLVSKQFNIDATAPTVSCEEASPGPTFVLGGSGGSVKATVTDETSKPSATSLSLSGAANVSSVGNKSVSLTGKDNAGNSTTLSCPYTVKYSFLGPFSPISPSSYKVGSTIPVKFALANDTGTRISDAAAQALVASSSCKVKVSLEGGTKNCATYNATTNTFQYNLKVPKNLSSGTYAIVVEVSAPDGSVVNKERVEVTIRR